MMTRHYQLIPKILVSGAIAVGFCVGGAAPASANPDPYGGLHCSCQEKAPAGSADPTQEIKRGLKEGHTALVPGLPAPAQPRQPQQ